MTGRASRYTTKMPTNNEGLPAPESLEGKALAELEKEGDVIDGNQPPEMKKEETPPPKAEEKKEIPPETEKKPDRSPTMVEAWKLKVAEDQKETALKQVTDLSAQIEKLSQQKAPITETQKNDIAETIKSLAKDKDVDVEFLTGFANEILKTAEAKYKPSADVEKTLKTLQEKDELNAELAQYSDEFEKDVLPLVKDYQLSDQALSDLKKGLRDIAFSETYAKVPLKEIFAIKQSTFSLTVPKKSAEGKNIKVRANEVVDLDNVSEEEFGKMTPEQVEAFASRNTSGWSKPSSPARK